MKSRRCFLPLSSSGCCVLGYLFLCPWLTQTLKVCDQGAELKGRQWKTRQVQERKAGELQWEVPVCCFCFHPIHTPLHIPWVCKREYCLSRQIVDCCFLFCSTQNSASFFLSLLLSLINISLFDPETISPSMSACPRQNTTTHSAGAGEYIRHTTGLVFSSSL